MCGVWEKAKLWRQRPAQELPGTRVGEEAVDGSVREPSRGEKKLRVRIVVRSHDHTFVTTYQTLQKGDFLYHNEPELF